MACKAGEIKVPTDWDDYGLEIDWKCVKAGSSMNNNSSAGTGSSTWDKIMEAADKILQGAEIITGNKATKAKKKGDFGGDVITNDRNGLPQRSGEVITPAPSVFDNKIVLIGGGILAVVFIFLMFKAFGKKKDAASVVAPVMK